MTVEYPEQRLSPWGDALKAYIDGRDRAPARPAVIGDLGNSLASNGVLSYHNRANSGAVTLGGISYLTYALPRTGGRFILGGVAATNGFTSQQIIETHLPSVISSNWDYVLLQVPTNDLGAGSSVADTIERVKAQIIEPLLAVGKTPILVTIPPIDTNVSGAGLTWISTYNTWARHYAIRAGLPLVDYHQAVVNPATNAWRTGFASDGLHPVSAGAQAMGLALAETLNSLPLVRRFPLADSYSPDLMLADAVITSTGADKIVASGPTSNGWAYGAIGSSADWRGNAAILRRGADGNASLALPIQKTLVAGRRVRVAFNLDIPLVPAGGTWSAYLYNTTEIRSVVGFAGIPHSIAGEGSVAVNDGVVTSGSNQITSASKPFRPEHVGKTITAISGITKPVPDGTTVVGVSPDGGTAYMSANATSAIASGALVAVLGKPRTCVFEFEVQPDMVGDSVSFWLTLSGVTGVVGAMSQVTITDLTTLP